MNENQKKALTGAAVVTGYIAMFMFKAMTAGVRTAKPSRRRRF